MNLQRHPQPERGDKRQRRPPERGTASYAGKTSVAAGNQAALLTGSICNITGNQQILQLYSEGTYGKAVSERKRLSASHGSVDTSGSRFQMEHTIGFAVVNPTQMGRGRLSSYESSLFAYAEIYLAHRAHIGTGKGTINYTMPSGIKASEEARETQQIMQPVKKRLEDFIQRNKHAFSELVQRASLCYCKKLQEKGKKKNKKTLREFLSLYLDQWVSFIINVSMDFLGQLEDRLKSSISQKGLTDFVKDRCLDQLLSELQSCLGFRRRFKLPFTMTMDRGFESDSSYREHQRAAVYEEQQIDSAVQLNQLGYAQIYDYIIRKNLGSHIELQIANDSFLYMAEHMLSVRVIDTKGKPNPQTGALPDKICA